MLGVNGEQYNTQNPLFQTNSGSKSRPSAYRSFDPPDFEIDNFDSVSQVDQKAAYANQQRLSKVYPGPRFEPPGQRYEPHGPRYEPNGPRYEPERQGGYRPQQRNGMPPPTRPKPVKGHIPPPPGPPPPAPGQARQMPPPNKRPSRRNDLPPLDIGRAQYNGREGPLSPRSPMDGMSPPPQFYTPESPTPPAGINGRPNYHVDRVPEKTNGLPGFIGASLENGDQIASIQEILPGHPLYEEYLAKSGIPVKKTSADSYYEGQDRHKVLYEEKRPQNPPRRVVESLPSPRPHLTKEEYNDAVERNLHVWSQWRAELNDDIIERGRPEVPPLEVVVRGDTPYDTEHVLRDPVTLMKYSVGVNQVTELPSEEFLQFGIPRANTDHPNKDLRDTFNRQNSRNSNAETAKNDGRRDERSARRASPVDRDSRRDTDYPTSYDKPSEKRRNGRRDDRPARRASPVDRDSRRDTDYPTSYDKIPLPPYPDYPTSYERETEARSRDYQPTRYERLPADDPSSRYREPKREREPRREPLRSPPRSPQRDRESYREPPRESYREPAREPPRESYREPLREPMREPYREPPRESYRAPVMESYREPFFDPLADSYQEPRQLPKKVEREPIRDYSERDYPMHHQRSNEPIRDYN